VPELQQNITTRIVVYCTSVTLTSRWIR